MSDTPRTDEALSYNKGYPNYQLEQVENVSRDLERELNSALEKLDRYTRRSESGESIGDLYDMADRLAEAQAEIAGMREAFREIARGKMPEDYGRYDVCAARLSGIAREVLERDYEAKEKP